MGLIHGVRYHCEKKHTGTTEWRDGPRAGTELVLRDHSEFSFENGLIGKIVDHS
jgi:hypothetical protein